jgi:hypothetical protein
MSAARHTPEQQRAARCLDECLTSAKRSIGQASLYADNAGARRYAARLLRLAEKVEQMQAAIGAATGSQA